MRDDAIKIIAVGDLFLGGEFIMHAHKNEYSLHSPFKEITPLFADTDILLANLEGPLFNGGQKRPGASAHLHNHHALLDWFDQTPNVIVNLANNHILDYGHEDFIQTIALLDKYGIQTIGAGIDDRRAYEPAVLSINSKSIAFVAYTTDDPHVGSIIADSERPGCASLSDLEKATRQVSHLKLETDYVAVVLHWGFEYFQYPSPDQVEMAHQLVDAGADLIIGHHPHVVQGIENYNDAFILYSLGNFFFPPFRDINGRLKYQKNISKEFMIVAVDVNGNGSGHKLKTFGGRRTNDYSLRLFKGSQESCFHNRIDHLSAPILAPDYASFWDNYRKKRTRELEIESLKEAFVRLFTLNPRETLGKLKISDLHRNFHRLGKFFIH